MLSHQFGLWHCRHCSLQAVDLIPGWGVVDDFNIGQNVPPPMPFKAVKLVNLPAAGVVKPTVESLIVQLSIVTFEIEPPVMMM